MSDTPYEVEVTLTFSTLAPPNSLAEPNELATLMRERWIEEPNTLVTVVIDAILDHDYHLKVLPGYGP